MDLPLTSLRVAEYANGRHKVHPYRMHRNLIRKPFREACVSAMHRRYQTGRLETDRHIHHPISHRKACRFDPIANFPFRSALQRINRAPSLTKGRCPFHRQYNDLHSKIFCFPRMQKTTNVGYTHHFQAQHNVRR